MQQEQDTCRICSGPGEPDQPLFYPCKCSGTIRYIHQDCLKTWLDHSKKTTCDVCKHPYAFTKVYSADMPGRVPLAIIVREFALHVVAIILLMLRVTLVAFVWLTLLPYGTVLTWRLYFRMGDILAWWISLHPRPLPNQSSSNDVLQAPSGPKSHFHNLSKDIFTGQIIASLIVLAFLAIFLLREWIQQNARPGVFDDGPAADVPAPVDLRPQAEPEGDQVEAVPVEVNHDVEARRELHDIQLAAEPPEMGAPALPPASRPVPDVPEDVRPAGPSSSSSSSSSDTEGPALQIHRREHSPQVLGRRGNHVPQRRILRVPAPGWKRRVDVERLGMENIRPRRFKGVEGEFSRLESVTNSYGSSGAAMSARLGDGSKSPKVNGVPADQGPEGAGSGTTIPAGFKARQKRKADEDDSDSESRHSSSLRSRHPPLTSPSLDFEFTFQPPRVPPEVLPMFPATHNVSQSGDFKLDLGTPSFTNYGSLSPSTSPSGRGLGFSQGAMTFSSSYPSASTHPLGTGHSSRDVDSGRAPTEVHHVISDPSPGPSSFLGGHYSPKDSPPPHFQLPTTDRSQPPIPSSSQTHSTVISDRPPLVSELPSIEWGDAEERFSTAGTEASVTDPSPHYRLPDSLKAENGDGESFSDAGLTRPGEHKADEEGEEEAEDDTRFAYYFREPEQDDAREAPPPLLPDTDDEEEDDDVHDADEPQEGVVPEPPDVVPLVAGDAAGQDVDADIADDERDQNLEEDLDGAMEAVGLRGPVFAVFQNAALMLFILNVSIAGGVWIPFTLGKTVVLLTLEPRRALQIIHLPIRAVRLATDPAVDGIIYCLRFLTKSLLSLGKYVCTPAMYSSGVLPRKDLSTWTSIFFKPIDTHRIVSLFTFRKPSPPQIAETASWTLMGLDLPAYVPFLMPSQAFSLFSPNVSKSPTSSAFQLAEAKFAILGRHVRLALTAMVNEWVELAEGDGTLDRLWAIFLGYAITAFLAALYLNTFTVGNVKSAGRAIRNAIRQQMIVLKVALFIIVELVMFPFGCGVMLDFSTLVLFPEASVESRLAFFVYAPVTAAFYHWLIGTMFMYQFAILLATCREILRPGCMWFIKDPQDPTFHPIRDILDRPTFSQLRKLCMSAVMYAVVISFGVGSILWTISIASSSFLPLRWKMREPLSEIPVDLLFVHLILPPTLHYFRPKKPVRRLLTAWWQLTAQKFRLTSFMFGGRHPNEEVNYGHRPWRSLLPGYKGQPTAVVATQDGGFRRAPAGDNIAFLRDRPALVEVDENGVPLDPNGREILLAQNAEAEKAGRNSRDDYTVVYVPPDFRRRIILFILLFWLSGSVAMVFVVAIPIFAGRAVLALVTPRELHDGYSFIIGFYLLWWSWLVGSLIVRIRVRRQRHGGGRRIRAGWFLFLSKRVAVYASKITWMVFWLGFVLPTLVSVAVDLYLVIPIRFLTSPNFTPTIHVFESWATGLILSKIIIRTQRTRPGNDLRGALDAIQRNGWRRPEPWAATRDFIIPIGTGLVGMIVLPPLAVYGCSRIFSNPWKLEDSLRLIYPAVFVIVAAFQFTMSLGGVFGKWTQGIRDKEFLVELRLRNLDQPRKPEKMDPPTLESAEDQEEEVDGDEQDGEED